MDLAVLPCRGARKAAIGEHRGAGTARRLLILAEVSDVSLDELLGPIGDGFETAREEAERLGLVNEAKTADHVTVIVEPLDTVDHVLGLREGEDTARECETYHLDGGDMLGAVGISLLGERAALHAADTAAEVERRNQRACGILIGGDVTDDLTRVDVRAETAARGYHRDAKLVKLANCVCDELRSLRDDVEIHRLLKADDQRLHFLDGHTAVGEEALKHGDVVLQLVEENLVAYHDAAATTEAELAGGEIYDVKEIGDHSRDLGDGFILQRFLTGLVEVKVILKQRCVEDGGDAVALGELGCRLHILVGDGLTADEVGACLQTQISDVLSTLALDAINDLVEVDVALEGERTLGDKTLVTYQLLNVTAETGNVSLGGGEVIVHDDALAGLDEVLCDDVLTGAALVCGEQVLDAEDLRELRVHAVEGLASRIGVVGAEHGGLHIVTHGVNAGVGEHIHKDIAVVEHECIKARVTHLLKTCFCGKKVQLLYDLDLVHFHGHGRSVIKFNFRHFCPP